MHRSHCKRETQLDDYGVEAPQVKRLRLGEAPTAPSDTTNSDIRGNDTSGSSCAQTSYVTPPLTLTPINRMVCVDSTSDIDTIKRALDTNISVGTCAHQNSLHPTSGDNPGKFLERDQLTEKSEQMRYEYDTCFGMVKIDTHNLRTANLVDDSQMMSEASVTMEGENIVIRNIDSREYGGLLGRENPAARTLRELLNIYKVTLQALLLPKKKNISRKPTYDLYVIIYGKKNQAGLIGEFLDLGHMFLQHPYNRELPVSYYNPHYLHDPAMETDFSKILGTVTARNNSHTTWKTIQERDPLKIHLQEAFDSARGPETYSAVSKSSRLRTNLKQHQFKALSMMMEKERGNLEGNEFGSLWTLIKQQGDLIKYKNTVTGLVQTSFPHICHGGILADEPGLGKTLSTISLIASSLDLLDISGSDSRHCMTTLVVAPLSLLQEWERQISQHVCPGKMTYCKYYGSSKGDFSSLKAHDIVLTTYDTVLSDDQKYTHGGKGTLMSINWLRIVLDEAHIIRNSSTKRYQAIRNLNAQYRWCLTGTPIYNRVADYGSLLDFIGAYPFDHSTFNSKIAKPVMKNIPDGLEKLRRLVQATSLRRTKTHVDSDLHLPERRVLDHHIELSPEERKNYEVLKNSYAAILISTGKTMGQKYAPKGCVFQTISRLRQFCDHGLDLLPENILQIFEDSSDCVGALENIIHLPETCAHCEKPIEDDTQDADSSGFLDCGHCLCLTCEIEGLGETSRAKLCRHCFSVYHNPPSTGIIAKSCAADGYKPSAKVSALLTNLRSDSQCETAGPVKSVVFSCWTRMLDLIQIALAIHQLGFARIDGTKSERKRRATIERFRSDDSCNILLASIGTAGVGLDLTVATRVHLMEPQWTPMAECQAIDRVHRLGQMRDIIATRYVVNNSIEEYVIAVQEIKSKVMQQSFQTEGLEEVETARERLVKFLSR